MTSRITRRRFLAGTVAAALAACSDDDADPAATEAPGSTTTSAAPTSTTGAPVATTTTSGPTTTPAPRPQFELASDPFTVGVASGDPLHDSVILWTRLALEPDTENGAMPPEDVPVLWEVAADPDFAQIVASGVVTAPAALGHSVHVDAAGLDADSEYWYRFGVGDHASPIGRTRTFAAPGTSPERLRFAFSSCQNWQSGRYAAYRDLATQDIDAFVFLGDYIYEYAAGGFAIEGARSHQDFECETLGQYRRRYALYKSDPLLQQAHAHAPWIVTWDDHEVDNNYAGAISENEDDPDAFLVRRAAAYQAWYEHMPVRLDPPEGPDLEIHRSVSHGDLVTFHVLDTRQYRSDQQELEPFIPELGDNVQVRDEVLAEDPEQTMLGDGQETWLVAGVDASAATWDVLAQQVLMMGANAVPGADPPVIVTDVWDSYHSARRRLLESLAPSVDNLVTLTGDFHSAAVGDLRADPFDLDLPIVGTELMATSISSQFFDADDPSVLALVQVALSINPQLKWFDAQRGYTLCEVTPDAWTAEFRAVADPDDENSAVAVASAWRIDAGTPGAVRTDA